MQFLAGVLQETETPFMVNKPIASVKQNRIVNSQTNDCLCRASWHSQTHSLLDCGASCWPHNGCFFIFTALGGKQFSLLNALHKGRPRPAPAPQLHREQHTKLNALSFLFYTLAHQNKPDVCVGLKIQRRCILSQSLFFSTTKL